MIWVVAPVVGMVWLLISLESWHHVSNGEKWLYRIAGWGSLAFVVPVLLSHL